ncbi:ABC transporter permease [Ekhidna sp.]|uniref:ABC transporter permease n=1 Tax=Ekhidna sp. TaxID=2608089 RepID=UPI003C7BF272
MFDLEKSIKDWLQSFQKYEAFNHASRHEMELHLRDHIDDLLGSGLTEEEAFEQAITSFGSVSKVATESHYVNKRTYSNATIMLFNHLKVAFRNFRKHASFSFLNIVGLTLGITVVFLITFFVTDELSFDQFHEKKDVLYRIVETQHYEGQDDFPVAVTPTPLAPVIRETYPEIVRSTRAAINYDNFKIADREISEGPGLWVDKDFFDMFTFPLVSGSVHDFKNQLNALVLTEELAKKYFKENDPVGKTITINEESYEIIAVIENVPDNSHIAFDYVTNFEHFLAEDTGRANNWGSNWLYTFIELDKNVDPDLLNDKITDVITDNTPEAVANIDLYIQPLPEIYLDEIDYTAETSRHGEMAYVKIFSLVAVFILIISCINFMNLSTARATRRMKEVGLRKTVGASRSQLIVQFLSESILMSLIAVALASLLVMLILPSFNELASKQFEVVSLISGGQGLNILIGIVSLALLTGLIAGCYPAFYLSAIKPSNTLKSNSSSPKGGLLRKTLVVIQFSISVTLIISTLVVYQQFDYIQNADIGYNKDHVAYTFVAPNKSQLFNEQVRSLSGIQSVGSSNRHPGYIYSSSSGFSWPGKNPDDKILIHYMSIDENYIPTMQMNLKAGRNFSSTDSAAVIVNERAAEIMGYEEPIGETVTGTIDYKIVGLLSDFNFKSIHTSIEPMVIFRSNQLNRTYIKYNPMQEETVHAKIEKVWNDLFPNRELTMHYLDADFNDMYMAEKRTGNLAAYFALLAILISCLGLFGLVSYAVVQRKKEISVRKVLGASVPNLFALLAFDFSRLVLVSLFIALPLGWLMMENWLQSYAYRIDLSVWVFVFSAIAGFAVAFLTVSYQSIKAALNNPVNALRTE